LVYQIKATIKLNRIERLYIVSYLKKRNKFYCQTILITPPVA